MNSSLNLHHWSAVRALRTHFRFHFATVRRLMRSITLSLSKGSLSVLCVAALATTASASVPSADIPAADHYVYLSELPQPDELIKDAATNGLTILRLDHTADRVVVSYQYPDGHTATLGYALLANAGTRSNPVVLQSPSSARLSRQSSLSDDGSSDVQVVTPAPQVVYYQPAYPRYYYSDPWYDFWAPLTVGIGLGWATGWHGGYHGGHYHGGGWHGGGGRH